MCPKCKSGSLSPSSLGSSNYRCNVCGYTEFRPSPSVDSSSSRMSSAMNGFNNATDNLRRAGRAQDDAMQNYRDARKSQKQEKSGKGGWLVVVVVAIIVFFLLNGG